jgi:hypothetical protein
VRGPPLLAGLSTTDSQCIVGASVPPNRGRGLFKIEADAIHRVDRDGWCYSIGQKVRQNAFGGLSLNFRDFAPKKIRNIFGGAIARFVPGEQTRTPRWGTLAAARG